MKLTKLKNRARLLPVAAAAVLALSACGSATSVDVPTTVAPLTANAPSSASALPQASGANSAGSSGSGASASAQPSAANANAEPTADPSKDQVREVSEIPTPTSQYAGKDKSYLDEVAAGGIEVAGVEQQLLGIAQEVCQAKQAGQQSYLVDAIGGQLAEQGHTQLSAEDAGRVLTAAAEKAYC